MFKYDRDTTHPGIEVLQKAIYTARTDILKHQLYSSLNSRQAVTAFMEHHVFAVWDFMSLLKSLQRQLTSVSVPWIPNGSTGTRRLINDIVLVEESDELHGSYTSHFELYVAAMNEAGADTTTINEFISALREGTPVASALTNSAAPAPAIDFVTTTWDLIENSPLHCQAAAFAFGREDLIPDMFIQVAAVNTQEGRFDTFMDYLQRHIEVDGEEHTPMAMQMLADLCGYDQQKWRDCVTTVNAALRARAKLWDGVLEAIQTIPSTQHQHTGTRRSAAAQTQVGVG